MADLGLLVPHADAVLTLLYADPDLTVFPAANGGPNVVPNGQLPPYVSVHFVAARPLRRLSMRSVGFLLRAHIHCVGASDLAARLVSDLVASALIDARPNVPGRACSPIQMDSENQRPPAVDQSTGFTTVTITDVYRIYSEPGRDGS